MSDLFILLNKLPYEIKLQIITMYISLNPKSELNELHYLINKSYLIDKFFNGNISVPNSVYTHKLSLFNTFIIINNQRIYEDYHRLNLFIKIKSFVYEIISYQLKVQHDGYDKYGAKSNLYSLYIICMKNNLEIKFYAYREFYYYSQTHDNEEYIIYKKTYKSNELIEDNLEIGINNEENMEIINQINKFSNIEDIYTFDKITYDINLKLNVKKNIHESGLFDLKVNYGRL